MTRPEDHAAHVGPALDPLAVLWNPATIRLRCGQVAQAVEQDRSGWFTLNRQALPDLAARLAQPWQAQPPDVLHHATLSVPWRLCEAAAPQTVARLEELLAGRTPDEQARALIDLAVISVLLGAKPGSSWAYEETAGQGTPNLALPAQRQQRGDLLAMLDLASGTPQASGDSSSVAVATQPALVPEPEPEPAAHLPRQRHPGVTGLAVATLNAFLDGVFSDHPHDPLRVDGRALTRLDAAAVRAVFQRGPGHPLPDLEGRTNLLRRMGDLLESDAKRNGLAARPSVLWDVCQAQPATADAAALLQWVANRWAPIWPLGRQVLGLPAGDVWPHLWAGAETARGRHLASAGWVPLHHRSQQLVLALVEPLRRGGLSVHNLQALTAGADGAQGPRLLAEGLISLRHTSDLARTWKPSDEAFIEWRAMTVHLMDELTLAVRTLLGPQAGQLPSMALAPQLGRGAETLPGLTIEWEGTLL